MKNASKYMLFMIIAIAAVPVTIAQVYSSGYRRGGLFGGGGVLGTGVGASRYGDYYSSEPGLISRTGIAVSDIADDITDGPNYRYRRGYRRGGFRRGYRRGGYRRGYRGDGYRYGYDRDGYYNRSSSWWN